MIETEKTIEQAYLRRHPTDNALTVKVLEDQGDALIVRVYTKVPKLRPSPYQNLRFHKNSKELSDLSPEEREQFMIKNYK